MDKSGKMTTIFDTAAFAARDVCPTETEGIVVYMLDQREKKHVVIYSPRRKEGVRDAWEGR